MIFFLVSIKFMLLLYFIMNDTLHCKCTTSILLLPFVTKDNCFLERIQTNYNIHVGCKYIPDQTGYKEFVDLLGTWIFYDCPIGTSFRTDSCKCEKESKSTYIFCILDKFIQILNLKVMINSSAKLNRLKVSCWFSRKYL